MKQKESVQSFSRWLINILLIIIITVLSVLLVKASEDDIPEGWIVYRSSSEFSPDGVPKDFNYFIMDGDGNQVQWIGSFRGNPSWSPDGYHIAVSCWEDVNQLCIIDVSTIPDVRTWPIGDYTLINPSFVHISLPDKCEGLISPLLGLESISWSYDGKKIAVVCGDRDYFNFKDGEDKTDRVVCILEYEEEKWNCWEDFPIPIYQAFWSPVDDMLVVSRDIDQVDISISREAIDMQARREAYQLAKEEAYALYLVDSEGSSPQFLVRGIAPAWSPDGKRIAFMARYNYIDTEHRGGGIGVIEKDGTGFEWLLKNDGGLSSSINLQCNYGCKLSWSPDGKYIVFSGEKSIGGSFQIIRLNVESGEAVYLTLFDFIDGYYSVPDWGLPNKVW